MHLPWHRHRDEADDGSGTATAVVDPPEDEVADDPLALTPWEIAEAKRHAYIESASRQRDVRYSEIPRR